MPKKSETANETPKPRKSAAAQAPPTHDQIALRAYHLYLQRHGAPGNPFDDWRLAEQQLVAESAKPKSRRKSKIVSIAA